MVLARTSVVFLVRTQFVHFGQRAWRLMLAIVDACLVGTIVAVRRTLNIGTVSVGQCWALTLHLTSNLRKASLERGEHFSWVVAAVLIGPWTNAVKSLLSASRSVLGDALLLMGA